MPRRSAKHRGFTLVELLIGISIMLILIAMLLPIYNRMIGWGRLVKCQSGLHQLTLGWVGYANNNKKILVLAEDNGWGNAVAVDGRQPGKYLSWVDRTKGRDKLESITGGALWPYMANSFDIYRCPDDPGSTGAHGTQELRSYAISTTMGGNNGIFNEPWEKHMVGRLDMVPNPGSMFVFVEEDGSFADSWIMHQKGPQIADQRTWWFRDDVAWNDEGGFVWHLNTGQSFSFADGHAEYWAWQNIQEDHGANGYWHMYDLVNEDLHKVIRGHSPHFGKAPPLPTP